MSDRDPASSSAPLASPPPPASSSSPLAWTARPQDQAIEYPDREALARSVARLAELPPLVTSGEVEHLRQLLAEAQAGKRFLLWGGDCAEKLDDCTPAVITAKLKILLQMSLVLVFAGKKPVIRVGRFAGQYAKPRSSPTETRTVDGRPLTLPSYFGDLINRHPFTPEARRPDPELLIAAYQHAGLTLNFVRALIDAGFADIHHPEYWELGFLQSAGLTSETRQQYQALLARLADSIEFMQATGEKDFSVFSRVDFFTSHEALNLWYDSAQTRTVPRKDGWWNLTTHLPWIGERTRRLDGAHVHYAANIRNPVGVKVGPKMTPTDLIALIDTLNPRREAGKLVLVPRMGAEQIERALPPLVRAAAEHASPVLWVCDPMHGNGLTTSTGIKTRRVEDILREVTLAFDICKAHASHLGGVHVELTGQDVTECLGGASNLSEDDLTRNYTSFCDPRLNYEQSMELAFSIARALQP
jgi:3-deoxy-7-phosphoheptulonate synthase